MDSKLNTRKVHLKFSLQIIIATIVSLQQPGYSGKGDNKNYPRANSTIQKQLVVIPRGKARHIESNGIVFRVQNEKGLFEITHIDTTTNTESPVETANIHLNKTHRLGKRSIKGFHVEIVENNIKVQRIGTDAQQAGGCSGYKGEEGNPVTLRALSAGENGNFSDKALQIRKFLVARRATRGEINESNAIQDDGDIVLVVHGHAGAQVIVTNLLAELGATLR